MGCAIKKRSAEYRAKETLKIAIANGTIRQLLWNEITLSASESSDDDKSEESPEFDQSSDWNNMLQRKPLVSVGSRSTVLNGNVLQKPSSPVPSGRRSINRSKTGLSEVNTKEIKKRFSRKEEQSQAEELEDLERESSEGQIFKRQYVRPKSFVDIMRKLKEGVQEAKTVMLGEVAEDSEQGSHDDEGSHSEGCDPAAQDDLNGWKEGDISNVHVEVWISL